MDIILPLTIKIMVDKNSKDASFIAYTPEVDVSSCGPTEEKARQNLKQAVKIVLEELHKKGALKGFLQEMGFQKEQNNWIAPRVSFETYSFSSLNSF